MAKYYRKSNVIRSMGGDERFKFINEAKRRSRELQQAAGGLGRGSLQVVDKLPKMEIFTNG